MKISKIFFETILPITLGTVLFVTYFFVIEKLSVEPELESCEENELSSATYLIFTLAIILISSLYQIVFGNWVLKRNWNRIVSCIINSIIFSAFFTVILMTTELFNGESIEMQFCIGFFLVMLLLGLLLSVLINGAGKYYKKLLK